MSTFIEPLSPSQKLYKQAGLTMPNFTSEEYLASEREKFSKLIALAESEKGLPQSTIANQLNLVPESYVYDSDERSKLQEQLHSNDVSDSSSEISFDEIFGMLNDMASQEWENYTSYTDKLNAEARDFASLEAEKNRQWQEKMSNTSYQRAFEDMKEAGLNPYAYSLSGQVAQASTPSGSMAESAFSTAPYSSNVEKTFSNIIDYLGQVSNSAYQSSQSSSKKQENFNNLLSNLGKLALGVTELYLLTKGKIPKFTFFS